MPELHIPGTSSHRAKSKGGSTAPHSVDSAIVKRLRRRFLTTSMSALLIIVVLMVAVINIANYSQISISAFETLELLAENSGTFPDSSPSGDAPDNTAPSDTASSDEGPADSGPAENAPSGSDPSDADSPSSLPPDQDAPKDSGDGPGGDAPKDSGDGPGEGDTTPPSGSGETSEDTNPDSTGSEDIGSDSASTADTDTDSDSNTAADADSDPGGNDDSGSGSDSAEDGSSGSGTTSGRSSGAGPGSGGSDPGDPGSGSSGGKSPSRKNEHRSFPEIDINEARRMEAPYETRYFSVRLDADGNVLSTDTSHIAAVTEDVAQEYALTVYYNGRTRGSATSYRYLAVTEEDGNLLVLFVDCSSSLAEAQQLMWYSLGVGAVALVLMFILVWLFSGRSVAPVVESMEKQKRFISDAGHELKTPITIISANVDVLEMLGEQNEWTQSIRSQTIRMTDLINNMLTLTRMEEDSLPLVFTDVDFSALVQECAASFHAVAQAGGLDYNIAIREKLHVNGDPASLRQLCTILLDNAMKYSSEHGSVYLSVHREKKDSQRISESIRKGRSAGFIVLEVSNTCDAIPEGNLDRLFDRFYRADSSRTRESRATWHVAPSAARDNNSTESSDETSGKDTGSALTPASRRSTGGFGIGLSVAKAVVSAHGGTIHAHIDGDRLIRFEVILPEQAQGTMPAAESPTEPQDVP